MSTHLVTGAGSGIGAALADELHRRGDDLVLVARSDERAAEIGERYDGATVLVADLAEPASLESLVGFLPERLDSLVHVAGVVDLAPVGELALEELRATVDVNLVAPAVLTRICLPALRAAGGTVAFVNSTSGLNANPTWGSYAASKFGLRALADALRAEERANGVRVTSVYPSRTATPMQQKVHEAEGKAYDPSAWVSAASVARSIVHVLDLPADATVSDITIRSA